MLDACAAEAAHADAQLWVAVTPSGDVAGSGTAGGGALPPGAATQMLATARQAGQAIHRALQTHLAAARSLAVKPLIRG